MSVPTSEGKSVWKPGERIELTDSQLKQWNEDQKKRVFKTGATRDTDEGKLDYVGFLSPAVLERYARYMHKNREMKDGSLRASDNWKKGIPKDAYLSSAYRHFFEWWRDHEDIAAGKFVPRERLEEALCALMFNTMGYLFEELKR